MSDASSQPLASDAGHEEDDQGSMPLLQLESIIKHFGGLAAVDNLSFSLHKGEILGVIGPNGAGKSTNSRNTTIRGTWAEYWLWGDAGAMGYLP